MSGKLETLSSELRGLIVDDEKNNHQIWGRILQKAGIDCHCAENNGNAFKIIDLLTSLKQPLNIIITDIYRAGGNGDDFIRKIKSLHDDITVKYGLRVRHLPILVISGGGFQDALNLKQKEYPELSVLEKPVGIQELVSTVGDLIGRYRHELLSELQHLGMSVIWNHGRFSVLNTYAIERKFDSKLIAGNIADATSVYTNIILVSHKHTLAQAAVDEFEELINCRDVKEGDLQRFFEEHPEFLLGDEYDSYWAQPSLKPRTTGPLLRPDFIFKPATLTTLPWRWAVVDIKRPNVPLVTGSRLHPKLSTHVHGVIAQLRDYQSFFEDPRNHEKLRQRFGGLIPQPKLVAIIGRLPTENTERYGNLLSREDNIYIRTYDEILDFRKTKVEMLKALGL